MNIEDYRNHCLRLPFVEETTPFGPDVLVFKVGGKMFATLSLTDSDARTNLKCDPEKALYLREEYEGVLPGWHMNKVHWNTLILEILPDELTLELLRHSYDLVLASVPKSKRPG
jgi:predicted DNA-binding protein (MmcQ/YjbR family)